MNDQEFALYLVNVGIVCFVTGLIAGVICRFVFGG